MTKMQIRRKRRQETQASSSKLEKQSPPQRKHIRQGHLKTDDVRLCDVTGKVRPRLRDPPACLLAALPAGSLEAERASDLFSAITKGKGKLFGKAPGDASGHRSATEKGRGYAHLR